MGRAEQERLQKRPHPLPVFPKGTAVKVYMGAGWAKGTVQQSDKDACTVWLPQLRKSTRCRDARNIARSS